MEFLRKYWKECIIIILCIVCGILVMSTTCTKKENDKLHTNIEALNDTIHTYQLKNGELMYEKQGYLLEKQELEQYLDISNKEIRNLEKQLGSALATISVLKGQIRVDTLVMHDSIYHSADTVYIYFNYTDNWLKMDGTTIYKEPYSWTTLNSMIMDVPLKVGTSKDNKWFVTTDNPYINFTSIEGAKVEKSQPSRFSLGLQFGVGGLGGYGVCFSPNSNVYHGWIVGGGIYIGLGGTVILVER